MNKQESAWSERTAHIADFASPWASKEGFRAYGYPTARTFAGALAGFKGKRNSIMFHMLNTGEAGEKTCIACTGKLNQPALSYSSVAGTRTRVESPAGTKVDQYSTWYYTPSRGFSGGMHYQCSWSNLLGMIHALRDV